MKKGEVGKPRAPNAVQETYPLNEKFHYL